MMNKGHFLIVVSDFTGNHCEIHSKRRRWKGTISQDIVQQIWVSWDSAIIYYTFVILDDQNIEVNASENISNYNKTKSKIDIS